MWIHPSTAGAGGADETSAEVDDRLLRLPPDMPHQVASDCAEAVALDPLIE